MKKYALAEKYKHHLGKRFRLIGRTEVFECTHVADLGVCIAVKGRSSEHMTDARFADVVWIDDVSTSCSVPVTDYLSDGVQRTDCTFDALSVDEALRAIGDEDEYGSVAVWLG